MADIDALDQKLDADLNIHEDAPQPESSNEAHNEALLEKKRSQDPESHPAEGEAVGQEGANEEKVERNNEEEVHRASSRQHSDENQKETEPCDEAQEDKHISSQVSNLDPEKEKSKPSKPSKPQASKALAQKTLSPTKQLSKAKQFDLTGLINQKMNVYDGLKDQNLHGHFCSELRRKHLVKVGLITKEGYIVKNSEDSIRKKETYQSSKPLGNHDGNSNRIPSKPDLQFNPYLQGTKGRPASLEKQITKVQYEKELEKIESKVSSKK